MQVLGSRFWVIGSKVVAQSATTTRSLSLSVSLPQPARYVLLYSQVANASAQAEA